MVVVELEPTHRSPISHRYWGECADVGRSDPEQGGWGCRGFGRGRVPENRLGVPKGPVAVKEMENGLGALIHSGRSKASLSRKLYIKKYLQYGVIVWKPPIFNKNLADKFVRHFMQKEYPLSEQKSS